MFPEPSFTCLSNVQVKELPPGSPTGIPKERVTRFQSFPLHASRILQQKFSYIISLLSVIHTIYSIMQTKIQVPVRRLV